MGGGNAAMGKRSEAKAERCVVSVVDDDAAIRHALADLFDSAGYRTCTFEDAEAFLESGEADTTGVLITDIQMSGMDGIALMSRVARFTRRLPVIVITGRPDEELRRRAKAGGCSAFLRKPFDPASLLDYVEAALAHG